jgi:hypothetical protein
VANEVPKSLLVDAATPQIVMHFRRAILLKSDLKVARGLEQESKFLLTFNESEVGKYHVYDFGHLFDATHPDFLSDDLLEIIKSRADILYKTAGLFMPHQFCSFILRSNRDTAIYLYLVRQEASDLIADAFQYSPKTSLWVWFGRVVKERSTSHAQITGDTENMRHHLIDSPISCSIVLTLKSDAIEVEPAQWYYATEPAKPKAFQTKHPSVSTVRVNTNRIFREPSDSGPTGVKYRGSDVRSHERRVGNKVIIVREHTRNGGSPKPTMKVVKQ